MTFLYPLKNHIIDKGRKMEDSLKKIRTLVILEYFKLLQFFHYCKEKVVKCSFLTFNILFALNIGLNPKKR
jgi:hypothetical protein